MIPRQFWPFCYPPQACPSSDVSFCVSMWYLKKVIVMTFSSSMQIISETTDNSQFDIDRLKVHSKIRWTRFWTFLIPLTLLWIILQLHKKWHLISKPLKFSLCSKHFIGVFEIGWIPIQSELITHNTLSTIGFIVTFIVEKCYITTIGFFQKHFIIIEFSYQELKRNV